MYVYRDGIYFQAENEIIYPEIQRILKDNVTKNAKTETFHKIADMTSYPRSIFGTTDPNFIPVKNGVFNLQTSELLPHNPKYRFTYKLPIIYDPSATCPKTEAFFKQVLTEEQENTVQEWLGYYLYRSYQFKKAIIFVGEGDTGKTTLLEVITHFLGRENVSSVSLHKMTSDKFAAAHLYSMHGNIVDELSAKDITDTGNFKIATGGGSISGEYKFGNQFSFVNFSKFTFACNKIPDVTDFDDEAYFNRWMVIRFGNRIEKKIPNFIATLTTEEERSGLFNYALIGLRRLLQNGKFSYNKDAIDTKTEMMRSGSSIAMFASERLEHEQGAEMTKEELYEHYSEFCLERGLATETIKMLGTKIPFYVTYAVDGLITCPGKGRDRGWRNIKVIPTDGMKKESEKLDEEFNSIKNEESF
jgi:putative DNA primase/helicase